MMTKEEIYIQKFRMRRDEYSYRIQAPGLRKFEAQHGVKVTDALLRGSKWVMRVFFYTVCWNGKRIDEDEFLREWSNGNVNFSYKRREYTIPAIRKLLMRRALKFQRMLKL